jgi:hypothetical protein
MFGNHNRFTFSVNSTHDHFPESPKVAYSSRPVVLPVLRELRAVLSETRAPIGRPEKATKSQVAGRLGKGESVVRRFEGGENAPNYKDLDSFIQAYADATETSVFDLWDEAIRRAKAASSGEPGGERRRPPRRR